MRRGAVIATFPHYAAHVDPVLRLVDLPPDTAIVAGYPDLTRARKAGYTRFIRMEHGIGQSYGTSHPHYPGGSGHQDVGLFLTPNEHSANRWRKAYPRARVEAVGSPRLDTLPSRELNYNMLPKMFDDMFKGKPVVPQGHPPTVAISFHYDLYLVPETRSALPWFAPALPELKARFNLIGHSHPRDDLTYAYNKLGIEYVRDFDEVCRRADLYITDNSSTLYEFASTGRPVVVLNPPWYDRTKNYGLRFWEASVVGFESTTPASLVNEVSASLEWPVTDTPQVQGALDIVYAYRTGAAQRAADAIKDWLGDTP
jgi:CDP-glycerol:poly(glycerophosphate) glycerophosphotransferase